MKIDLKIVLKPLIGENSLILKIKVERRGVLGNTISISFHTEKKTGKFSSEGYSVS